MSHIRATDAKNQFGQLLDNAQHSPVHIEKNEREVAVVLSTNEYSRLKAYEDELWSLKAKIAKEGGFYSENESEAILDSLFNAES